MGLKNDQFNSSGGGKKNNVLPYREEVKLNMISCALHALVGMMSCWPAASARQAAASLFSLVVFFDRGTPAATVKGLLDRLSGWRLL